MKKLIKLFTVLALSLITAVAFAACSNIEKTPPTVDVTNAEGKTAFTNLITYMANKDAVVPDEYSINMEYKLSALNDKNALTDTKSTKISLAVRKNKTYYEANWSKIDSETGVINSYLTQIKNQYWIYNNKGINDKIKILIDEAYANNTFYNFNCYSTLSEMLTLYSSFKADMLESLNAESYSFSKSGDIYTLTINSTDNAEKGEGTETISATIEFNETIITSMSFNVTKKDNAGVVTGKSAFSFTYSNSATVTPPADMDDYNPDTPY